MEDGGAGDGGGGRLFFPTEFRKMCVHLKKSCLRPCYCLCPDIKCSCGGKLTIIIILVIFEENASRLEKIGPMFSNFNLVSSLPSVATDDRKQFQCRKIVFDDKTRRLF